MSHSAAWEARGAEIVSQSTQSQSRDDFSAVKRSTAESALAEAVPCPAKHWMGAGRKRRWTAAEQQQLRELYPLYRNAGRLAELPNLLHRQRGGIQDMACKLRLTDRAAAQQARRTRENPDPPRVKRERIAVIPPPEPVDCVRYAWDALNSPHGFEFPAEKLGSQCTVVHAATKGARPWTAADEAFLRANFGRYHAAGTLSELALQMGRTLGAITTKAQKLHLYTQRRRSPGEPRIEQRACG